MASLYEIQDLVSSSCLVSLGAGRIALNLQYALNLQFKYFIPVRGEQNVQSGVSSVNLKDISDLASNNDSENLIFILCSYKKEEALKLLVLDQEILLAEDVVKLMDFPAGFFARRDIAIVTSANESGKSAAEEFKKYYYGTNFDVLDADSLAKQEGELRSVIVVHDRAVNMERLLACGYEYNKNMAVSYPKGKRPSEYFMSMLDCKPKDMPICRHPFEFIEIIPSRDSRGVSAAVCLCCPMFIREHAGYLRDAVFDDIWQGSMARLQRLSMIDRSYYFCDEKHCRYMQSEFTAAREFPLDEVMKTEDYGTLCPERPLHVAIDIDQTCNLRCRYCRKEIHRNSGVDCQSLEIVTEKICQDLLPACNELMLAGNGEVFASKFYKDILYNRNAKGIRRLQLTTNALLMRREELERLLDLYEKIELWISIDAATKGTYEKVRKGGSWETLLDNLLAVKEYRTAGKVDYLRWNFIVTMESYLEMTAFIEMAKEYAVDSVLFQRMEHTGVLSDAEFAALSVFDEDGKLKELVMKYFDNEIFKDSIVNRQNNVLPQK